MQRSAGGTELEALEERLQEYISRKVGAVLDKLNEIQATYEAILRALSSSDGHGDP